MARVLYWFRTDLRLADSPALTHALSLAPAALYPVWTWDPAYVYGHAVGLNRWAFLLESMRDVSAQLAAVNPRQRLHVVRGPPAEVLPLLWREWGITHVVFEKDPNEYARDRDRTVKELAAEAGVQVVEVPGRHLFDPQEVAKRNGGKPTMTVKHWKEITKKMGDIARPVPAPTSLPDPGPTPLPERTEPHVHHGVDLNAVLRTGKDTCFDTFSGPAHDFAVPTLAEMGFDATPSTTIRGGPTEARRRLDLFLSQPRAVATFSKPHTAPTSLEPSTTLLSPYLKFGCVGVRDVWWGCKDVVAKWSGETSKEPENMFGQLEFRDMYACAEYAAPNFSRIRGNPVCRFIDWKLQNAYDDAGNEVVPRPRGDGEDEERLLRWREGRTGFPWIDACMRQLKVEGWIHHLARHSVACFLTRGQCYISWERGMEVFDEWLIDWDPASNPGNWMWLSCSAFFSQYYRVYGLVSWPKRTDTTGALVRKYCPELAKFPDKYIYAPHTAPLAVQEKAGCVIGRDYPSPMLDENVEKDRCVARLKDAYKLGLHGDAAVVASGEAADQLRAMHAAHGDGDRGEKVGDADDGEVVQGTKASESTRRARSGKRKAEGNGTLDGFVKRERR